MKKMIIAGALALASVSANAQLVEGWDNFLTHVSVGVDAGTTGYGFSAATTINQHIQMRAGVTFAPKIKLSMDQKLENYAGRSTNEIPADIRNQFGIPTVTVPDNVSLEGKLNMADFSLLFDLYPSKNSNFHFTVGFYAGKSDFIEAYNTSAFGELAAANNLNKTIDAAYANSTLRPMAQQANLENYKIGAKLGDYFLEPDAQGNMRANIQVKSFKPYLGIGFGRAVPKKNRVSFKGELGCQFWGTPKLMYNGTELEKSKAGEDASDALNIMSKITVYPVIKFRLAGRIF